MSVLPSGEEQPGGTTGGAADGELSGMLPPRGVWDAEGVSVVVAAGGDDD
jgi:hypothetical protein